MISLQRVTCKTGKHYYTKDCYYTKEGSIENSEWFGIGAKNQGLEGKVDPNAFQKILKSYTNKKNGEEARAALDLTFSAPKSVSLACLVNNDQRIMQAHHNAVNTALSFVEKRYSYTRVGSKENREILVTGNITAAKFTHDISREKDPQLHTHCVVFNKVQRPDGQWRSFHNDGIFNNSKLIGFVYQNQLAHEIQKLGYGVLLKNNGTFEIEGYTDAQIQEFSKRTNKIKELGCKTKKEERSAKLLNRPAKGKAFSRELLQEKWQQEANSVGIAHPKPDLNRTMHPKFYAQFSKVNIEDAVKHLSERDVRFKKEEIEKYFLSKNIGKIPLQSYQHEIEKLTKSGFLIEYKKGFYTTKKALIIEKSIVESIKVGKEKFAPIIEQEVPQKIFSKELDLTKGQKEALVTSLKTKDQFIAWQGVAGSGKTTAMKILKEISVDQEFQIKGFAPSAEAAQTLEKDSGIGSNTVASLLVTEETKNFNNKNKEIWIVDEAGLLCARDCEKLMEKSIYQNARVIFVGDTKQMSAVDAGNPFKLMQEKGIATAYLHESKRQKTALLKESVDLIVAHKIKEGLNKIKSNIIEIRDHDKKIDFIESEYTKLSMKEQEQTLILSATNEERKQITDKIRKTLTEQGKLKDSIQITHLVAKNQTTQERKSILNHNINDVLIFYKDHKNLGIEKERQYVIKSIDQKNEKLVLQEQNAPSRRHMSISPRISGFINYEQRKIDVAVGDKLRCTKNDNKIKVRNGQSFLVTGTQDNQVTLKSTTGRFLDFSNKNPIHLDHDYVNTVYSSQGKTCDKVIISGNKSFGKEMLYVAVSRARFSAVIATSNTDEFLKSSLKEQTKVSAMSLITEDTKNLTKGMNISQDSIDASKVSVKKSVKMR